MESLFANQLGKARHVTHNGRPHVAVPVRMIRVGVLPGTSGPLFYPASELERAASDWNGVPITVEHPIGPDGELISGNSKGVPAIGRVYAAAFRGDALDAEAWLDVEDTNRLAPGLIDRILRGYPIEVSTGLYLDRRRKAGEFNGKPYEAIALNHRPDHLAVLLSGPGACSVVDGCGIGVANGLTPLPSPVPLGIGYAEQPSEGPMTIPPLFETKHAGCSCSG